MTQYTKSVPRARPTEALLPQAAAPSSALGKGRVQPLGEHIGAAMRQFDEKSVC
jgi:hypothetical protein